MDWSETAEVALGVTWMRLLLMSPFSTSMYCTVLPREGRREVRRYVGGSNLFVVREKSRMSVVVTRRQLS